MPEPHELIIGMALFGAILFGAIDYENKKDQVIRLKMQEQHLQEEVNRMRGYVEGAKDFKPY